ncbi:unannotated protein [freshwater metagenome]|uniref:Unannotated protein n=1 Tax=freshwater metagenome TaxID=449393 RepID=A0A6J7DHX1_9ZZZZ
MLARAEVPVLQIVGSLEFPNRDAVEVVFEFGGEVVLNEVGVETFEQRDDGECRPAGNECRPTLGHISAFE